MSSKNKKTPIPSSPSQAVPAGPQNGQGKGKTVMAPQANKP